MHGRVSLLFLVVVSVTVFAVGCGSAGSARPANIAAPEIRAGLAGTVFFGSGTSAPANIDVSVTNRATVPIVLRRLEVDSPGLGTYGLIRTTRTVRGGGRSNCDSALRARAPRAVARAGFGRQAFGRLRGAASSR